MSRRLRKSYLEGNKSVELLLGCGDGAKRFAQLFPCQWRQLVGTNELSRGRPGLIC